jgi:hypothetical protein
MQVTVPYLARRRFLHTVCDICDTMIVSLLATTRGLRFSLGWACVSHGAAAVDTKCVHIVAGIEKDWVT